MLETIILKILILLQGFGAASGLVYHKNQLYIVADDKAMIFRYDFTTKNQENFPLETVIPISEMKKKDKLDLESIIYHKNHIYTLGSGSKENRNDFHVLNLKKNSTNRYDVSDLYQTLRNQFNISAKDFNIEGFAFHKGKTYLFNRGNGENKLNGIFIFGGKPNEASLKKVVFVPIYLPIINGNLTTFSDAIIINNEIIFTATIEDKSTVQKDGEVKESIIGRINLKDFKVDKFHIIAKNRKIEGLTLFKETKEDYKFLLCEDNDDDSSESKIYQLQISKDFDLLK